MRCAWTLRTTSSRSFHVQLEGLATGYLVALFVLDGKICTCELLAPEPAFTAHLKAVRAAIASLEG